MMDEKQVQKFFNEARRQGLPLFSCCDLCGKKNCAAFGAAYRYKMKKAGYYDPGNLCRDCARTNDVVAAMVPLSDDRRH